MVGDLERLRFLSELDEAYLSDYVQALIRKKEYGKVLSKLENGSQKFSEFLWNYIFSDLFEISVTDRESFLIELFMGGAVEKEKIYGDFVVGYKFDPILSIIDTLTIVFKELLKDIPDTDRIEDPQGSSYIWSNISDYLGLPTCYVSIAIRPKQDQIVREVYSFINNNSPIGVDTREELREQYMEGGRLAKNLFKRRRFLVFVQSYFNHFEIFNLIFMPRFYFRQEEKE